MADIEESALVLILIDVINGFDAEGGEGIVDAAHRAAPRILGLRERAHAAEIPVIYVNDDFGLGPEFASVVAACSATERPGHGVTRMLVPTEHDQLVLKRGNSAFQDTALEPLLRELGVRTVVLAGFATNLCVLSTALDAHARNYEIVVPPDCTAASSADLAEQALEQMRTAAGVRTPESLDIDLAALRYAEHAPRSQSYVRPLTAHR
jgi:nicotinamidase-related amidase